MIRTTVIKGKKGWLEIVEAFIAIVLIAAVALIVISQHNAAMKSNQATSPVLTSQEGMLSEIEANDTLRTELISYPYASLPVNESTFNTAFPKTAALIEEDTPGSLQCAGKLCQTNATCLFSGISGASTTVYASSVIISSSMTSYSPRVLKIFCW